MTRKSVILITVASLIILSAALASSELTGKTHIFVSSPNKETLQEANKNVAAKRAIAEKTQSSTTTSGGSPSQSSRDKTSSGITSPTATTTTPTTTQGKDFSPPSSSSAITITASQTNSTEVAISTKLAGYSDGTCNLTISNGNKTTTQSAQVMFEKQFSTCAGFTVPISTVGTGTWNVKLDVISGGTTTSKTISAEVK